MYVLNHRGFLIYKRDLKFPYVLLCKKFSHCTSIRERVGIDIIAINGVPLINKVVLWPISLQGLLHGLLLPQQIQCFRHRHLGHPTPSLDLSVKRGVSS